MNRRLQKGWIISMIVVLGLTTTLPSVNLVFAETVDETQNSEAEALSLPYDNLLESASRVESSVTQEPVTENEEPIFSFKQEEMTGVVGESTNAVILVGQPVDQVQVTIPEELEVSLDELPKGMEAKQMTDTLWWFSAEESKEFSIPLVSHSAGEYGLQIEDQIEGTITFEESENRDSTITSEVADTENEPVTSEVQEEEEAVKQETEDITPATTSNVSTWEQFRTAINTNSVTVINVNANVSGNTSLNNIDRNLTINGNGYTIYPHDQNFRINAGRQITVRNASFQANDILIGRSLFQIEGANVNFVLSDIRYWNSATFIGGTADFPSNLSLVFDRGSSSFWGGQSSAIVGSFDHVRIANGASVDVQDRVFMSSQNFDSNRSNNSSLTVDNGGQFTGRGFTRDGSLVNTANLNIQGVFEAAGLATPVFHSSPATLPMVITFGANSRVRMSGTRANDYNSALPITSRGIVLNIARGADYDLISQNGSVIGNNVVATSIINTANLAVWNLGQSSNTLPNLNFQNLEAQLSGTNSATITSTNHTAFRNHYSQQGLAGYSRISSTGIAEQTLSLEASPSAGGRPSADRTSMVPTASTNIRANPNAGYNFVRWEVVSGAGTIANSNSENTTFTMGSSTSTINATIRAVYEPIPVTYTLQLQASPTAGGSPQATSTTLEQGASTAISANPSSGYRFLRWETVSGGGSIANTTAENTTFVMGSANATIRAVYEEIPVTYTLQLQASPTAGGSPQATSTTLVQGASTAISANPNSGYRFLRWETVSGGGSIANTTAENTTFVMGSANATIRAVYEQIPASYTLQLQASPTTGGSPQASSTTLIQGASTTISANANSGYRFVRWEIVSGGGSITNTLEANTTFVMGSANATIRAVYEEIPVTYTLQLEASPVVGGSPQATSTTLLQGTSTTISARPNNGYQFVRWEIVSGGGSIANTTAENTTFTMGSANATIRAVYEQIPAKNTLFLTAVPTEGGNPEAANITLAEGETTTISAKPSSGYRFVRWMQLLGTGSFENEEAENTTFTMGTGVNSVASIAAVYELIPVTYTLQLQASPAEGGSPEADTTNLAQGASTVITANPNSRYRFVRWESVSGGGSIANTLAENSTFVMGSANATIRAVYEEIPVTYSLQLQASPAEGGSPEAANTNLLQGETTTILANPNSGYRFIRWETVSGGGSITNTTAEESTFMMDSANAIIRAVYEQIPATYTLQLEASPAEGGNPEAISTTLVQGETTAISAKPNTGYRFVRWEIVSGGGSITNTLNENTTFVMGSANATIRAVYEAYSTNYDVVLTPFPTIAGNPTASSYTMSPGETINLSANPNSGYRLASWIVVANDSTEVLGTGTIADPQAENTTFTMDSDSEGKVGIFVYYQQIQSYSLKLEANPAEGGNPEADTVDLIQGEKTAISANPNSGFRFVEWKILSGGGQISDKDAENTEFTMGSANTVLQAVFESEQPSVVNPLDPLDPEIEVNPENRPELPENQGLLSVDFISQFDFGKHTISVQEQTYYAKPQRLLDGNGTLMEGEERPNYVQVSDRRSPTDRIGWQLSVTQDKQFENEQGNELTGAEIQFKNQQLVSPQNGKAPGLEQPNMVSLVPGEKQALITAQEDSGTGTWIYRFGDADSASESVSLTIPSGTVPQASAYNTTFVWELSSVPENSGH
ncbi:hypothetical protein IGI86_003294 [Enterococcus sp. AZ188]|uniref:InlB B-repeat-containing protein n=1 Tax=Enterococcus sp. AZ188 TaxID=2774678 RepID=UPI003D2FEBD5